jgi:hypothetical protein
MSRAALFVAAALILFAPRARAKHDAPAPAPDVVLVGSISATTKALPPCGTGAFAMKLRVRVEQLEKGDYAQPFVDVLAGCPEMFAVPFVVGARVRLGLARKQPRPRTDWAVAGELPKPSFPELWLAEATLLAAPPPRAR